jgi:hypothetical protein
MPPAPNNSSTIAASKDRETVSRARPRSGGIAKMV